MAGNKINWESEEIIKTYTLIIDKQTKLVGDAGQIIRKLLQEDRKL